MSDIERIVLGSGKLYIDIFDGQKVPDKKEIMKEEKLLSYIQGGATIEYKATYYNAQDDLGYVMKSTITEEEATLKSGIMTFNGNTLKKICETARVTEDNGIRTVKIGGVSNMTGERYVLLFHHEDKVDGDIWVMIVGYNQAGFSLQFAKDKETVIDAEFKALPMDKQGTLIQYMEELELEKKGE